MKDFWHQGIVRCAQKLGDKYGPLGHSFYTFEGEKYLSITHANPFEFEGETLRWVMIFHELSLIITVYRTNEDEDEEIEAVNAVFDSKFNNYIPESRFLSDTYNFQDSPGVTLGGEFSSLYEPYISKELN